MVQVNFSEVKKNEEYDAWELYPKPNDEELGEFYHSKYYELLKFGQRAPSIARLQKQDQEAKDELDWLYKTYFSDYHYYLSKHSLGRNVLDFGCGMGYFVEYLNLQNYNACGFEPSIEAAGIGIKKGLDIHCSSFDAFYREAFEGEKRYDAISLLNVLEHVPRPKELVGQLSDLMIRGGVLLIDVPNDFNPLQIAAVEKLGLPSWWIARPDHISYFDFESLTRMLQQCGFAVLERQTSFPLEMFLLMGRKYIGDPVLGAACHKERREFELNIPTELRRSLYESFAQKGIGRSCVILAQKQ